MSDQSVTIQSHKFTIVSPFLAGHRLTAAEAEALNTLFAERIAKNFIEPVRRAIAKGGVDDTLRERIYAYSQTYKFRSKTSDPVEAEARAMARAALLARARAGQPGGVSDAEIDAELEREPNYRTRALSRAAAASVVLAEFFPGVS